MINSQTSKKQGFTIIEIVLVLAVAGLIFLMIFMAIPALQRAQRDNGRKRSVGLVVAAINSWKANNKGRSLISSIDRKNANVQDSSSIDHNLKTKITKWVSAVDTRILNGYLSLYEKGIRRKGSSLSPEILQVRIILNTDQGTSIDYFMDEGRFKYGPSYISILPGVSCPNEDIKKNGSMNYYTLPATHDINNAVITILESGGFYCENA